jgi:hypothetical protein
MNLTDKPGTLTGFPLEYSQGATGGAHMDAILKRYCPESLPLEEQARLGCLPDRLTIGKIATLCAEGDKERARLLCNAIRQAAIDGALECNGNPNMRLERRQGVMILDDGCSAEIHRDDFAAWLQREGEGITGGKIGLWLKVAGTTHKSSAMLEAEDFYKDLLKALKANGYAITKSAPERIAEIALSMLNANRQRFSLLDVDIVGTPATYETSLGNHRKMIIQRLARRDP